MDSIYYFMEAITPVMQVLNAFSGILGLVAYVLHAIGLYTIAKRRGIHNPWFAWIPFLNLWLLGCISDQYREVAKGKVTKKRVALITLAILSFVFSVIMVVASIVVIFALARSSMYYSDSMVAALIVMLVSALITLGVAIAEAIVYYICAYDLFLSCSPNNAVLFLVLSILFSWLYQIFVFAVRKRDEGMPARVNYYAPPAIEGGAPVDQ